MTAASGDAAIQQQGTTRDTVKHCSRGSDSPKWSQNEPARELMYCKGLAKVAGEDTQIADPRTPRPEQTPILYHWLLLLCVLQSAVIAFLVGDRISLSRQLLRSSLPSVATQADVHYEIKNHISAAQLSCLSVQKTGANLTSEACSDIGGSCIKTVFANGKSEGGIDLILNEQDFIDESLSPPLFSTERLALFLSSKVPVKLASLPKGEFAKPSKRAQIFTDQGHKVKTFSDVKQAVRLYVVPEGIQFYWPFVELGHTVRLSRDQLDLPEGVDHVELESISERPRVFHIRSLFTASEADEVVALVNDSSIALKRSTVNMEDSEFGVDRMRTSDGAFDSQSSVSQRLLRRMFQMLRIPEYNEEMADGLQILRYQQKQAYNAHFDYFPPDAHSPQHFNFNPSKNGSNRFATVFLYLNDVPKGGQTAFPEAAKPRHSLMSSDEIPAEVADLYDSSGWETEFVKTCYSRLAVAPRKATAVLFYSQTEEGDLDSTSLHGGCPVIEGTKWGANLWVWNKARFRPPPESAAKKENILGATNVPDDIHVTFHNLAKVPVKLVWNNEKVMVPNLSPGEKTSFNTYLDHRWHAEPTSLSAGIGQQRWATIISDPAGARSPQIIEITLPPT